MIIWSNQRDVKTLMVNRLRSICRSSDYASMFGY
jgi:hypothetical protein